MSIPDQSVSVCGLINNLTCSSFSCYDGQHYSGKSLATVLIHQTTNSPLPTRRNEDNEEGVGDLVQSALSLLVANSHSAKQAALDGGIPSLALFNAQPSFSSAGLLESTIECAIALLTKLRQQSVGQHRQVKKVCCSPSLYSLKSLTLIMYDIFYLVFFSTVRVDVYSGSDEKPIVQVTRSKGSVLVMIMQY